MVMTSLAYEKDETRRLSSNVKIPAQIPLLRLVSRFLTLGLVRREECLCASRAPCILINIDKTISLF
jgi:hypothetical protein